MDEAGQPVLKVRNLRTGFATPAGTVVAVDDVSFDIRRGEILAIIGESGSGKTVTALSLIKLITTPPGKYLGGSIELAGADTLKLDEAAMEGVRGGTIGMIFQNPRASLDPSFTVEFQLVETMMRHDSALDRSAALDIATRSLQEVGFPDTARVLASYPHQLSGGMCQRVGLAMVLACSPKLLIADEPTTALDVGVQAKILLLLKKRNRESGLPIIIITHDIGVVRAIATRVLVMYGGHIQEEGEVDELLSAPLHPYTQALIRSIPDPDAPAGTMTFIRGEPPNLLAPPRGCRFAPRCERATAICHAQVPEWRSAGGGRMVRCHLAVPEAVQ
ncbi:ABC transporter ATP-binding protein [Mesorhizobium sp.]|uniref:ABC transporter ATP-binding protein n=1 Tax=Mesorhizobium sp. TaxID=1871066 RepID=UPI0025FE3BD5|nr:ABC transporter ATP-binding protein [Mesorhizobium sp.]